MARIRDSIDSRVFDIENYVNELQGPHVSGPVSRGTYLTHVQILLNVIHIMEANHTESCEKQEEQEQILVDLEEINNDLRARLTHTETELAATKKTLTNTSDSLNEMRNISKEWQQNFTDANVELQAFAQKVIDLDNANAELRATAEAALNAESLAKDNAAQWQETYAAAADELAFVLNQRDWYQRAYTECKRLYAEKRLSETDITLLDSDPHPVYVGQSSTGKTLKFRTLEAAAEFGTVIAEYPPWLDIEPEAE